MFHILQDVVNVSSFEYSIETYQKSRYGRSSYRALFQHNLMSSKWDKIVEDYETYVMNRGCIIKNHWFALCSHEANNKIHKASYFVQYELTNKYTTLDIIIKLITYK